jgi:hypothetical protein
MKEIYFNFGKHRYYQKMIVFSLERVIFVNDYEFDRIIRFTIKDYLK